MLKIQANEDLGWVIRKNPHTQKDRSGKAFKKRWRNGVFYGCFISLDTFLIQLRENRGQCSFGNWSYITLEHLYNPVLYIGMLDSLLRDGYKKRELKDNKCTLSFFIKGRPKVIKTYLEGLENSCIYYGSNTYELHVKHESIYKGLNWLMCLSSCLALLNGDIPSKKENIIKIGKCVDKANLNYYQRYWLSLTHQMTKYISNDKYHLVGGNTAHQRLKAIREILNNSNLLYDLGCNNFYISKRLKYKNVIGIDKELKDPPKGYKFIQKDIYADTLELKENSDILLSEVIEHNDKRRAKDLINKLLESKPNRLVITVPNKKFNVCWSSINEFRHVEHKWEPTMNEFIDFLPKREGYKLDIKGIGDHVKIDNIYEPISLIAKYSRE